MMQGRDVTHLFDLTDAYQALGITTPCRIVARDDPDGSYGSMFPADPQRRIYVSPTRIAAGPTPGCDCPNCQHLSIEGTIAHELVHWAQADHLGLSQMWEAHNRHSYDTDPIEVQASELGPTIAKLIRRA